MARVWSPLKEAFVVAASSQRRRDMWGTPFYANSAYLMANSATTAALGFVFWIVIARFYAVEDVGLGSALISVAGLLVFVANLGLGMGLIRFLPGAGVRGPALINSCLTLSGIAATALAAIFIMGIPLWSPVLGFVREDPIFIAAFIAFVVAANIYYLLTEIFVALRRAEFLLIQGLPLWLLRLAIVAVMASGFKVFGIFFSWGLPAVLGVGLGLFLILPRLSRGYRPVPNLQRQVSNEMFHFSLVNYLSMGLWNAPYWLLPLMVVNLLGSQTNAYFYMSWSIAWLLFTIPLAVSVSLFAEGSHEEKFLARDVGRSIKLITVLLLPAMAVILAVGDKLLLLFGTEYSREGITLLWVLVPSALPVAVNLTYLGIARVKKRLGDILLVGTTVAIGTLGLSYLLMQRLGILAPGVAWLASHMLVALVVAPRIRRLLRSQPG